MIVCTLLLACSLYTHTKGEPSDLLAAILDNALGLIPPGGLRSSFLCFSNLLSLESFFFVSKSS